MVEVVVVVESGVVWTTVFEGVFKVVLLTGVEATEVEVEVEVEPLVVLTTLFAAGVEDVEDDTFVAWRVE